MTIVESAFDMNSPGDVRVRIFDVLKERKECYTYPVKGSQ
jgi:hypothetical protein